MTPEEKKYIQENAGKKSPRDIARHLNLKEKHVRRFLEKQTRKPQQTKKAEEDTVAARKRCLPLVIYGAAIIIFALIAYSGTFSYPFVWDDESIIVENTTIRKIDLREIFTTDLLHGTLEYSRSNCYRPIQVLSFALNYKFSGLSPGVFRATNIALHTLVALAIFWLVSILFRKNIAGLAAAMLFVAHPIHIEPVTYISSRADSLAALFMLLALIAFIYYRRGGNIAFLASSIFLYALAILSKESAAPFPLILLAYDLAHSENFKRTLKDVLPFAAILILYIFVRITIVKIPLTGGGLSGGTISAPSIPIFFKALAMYYKLLVYPTGLHKEYGPIEVSALDPYAIAGVVIALAVIAAAIFSRRKNPSIFFLILWFIIYYLPISNIIPLNANFSENWIYTPSIGLFIIAGWALANVADINKFFKWACLVLLFVLSMALSIVTQNYNKIWKDPETFFLKTLEYNPKASRVYYRLSMIYFEKGLIDKGIEMALRAKEVSSNYPSELHINLSNAYFLKGDFEKAISEGLEATKKMPNNKTAHLNLGVAYMRTDSYKEAVAEFNKSLLLDPYLVNAHTNLGIIFFKTGRKDEAIRSLKKAIELDPSQPIAYNALAMVYFDDKQYPLAKKYYEESVIRGVEDKELAKALSVIGDGQKSAIP